MSLPMFTKITLPLALCCGLSSLAIAQDTVMLRNGSKETGKIEAEDFDALKMKVKVGNAEQSKTFGWADVQDVTYGGVPELAKAMTEIGQGNAAAAITRLKALLNGSALRKELRPATTFHLGSAQLRAGATADAAATFNDLIKNYAKSRFLIPATRSLVELSLRSGDFAAGTAAVDAATAAAKEAGVAVTQAVAFDYFRGLLAEAKNDHVAARVSYQAATRGDGASATTADMAKLGVARVDATAGKTEEARSAYRALVENGRGNEVLAGAWNGLAKLALAEGVKAKNVEKVTDALFMYLRGFVQYGPAPGEGSGEYERALAGASEAYKALADLETDATLKGQHEARSRARLEQLRKEYPNSLFLPK